MFSDEVCAAASCVALVNHRHNYPSIELAELATMKSIRPQDGRYLTEWMQCYISKENMDTLSSRYSTTILSFPCRGWPSVACAFNDFCNLNPMKKLLLFSHRIVLRSKVNRVPLLSNKNGTYQGSHLCDTIGCLSKNHLVIETKEQNAARRLGEGIFLHIHRNSLGEPTILQLQPCQHGAHYQSAEVDPFQYSCRKIKIITMDDSKLKLLCG